MSKAYTIRIERVYCGKQLKTITRMLFTLGIHYIIDDERTYLDDKGCYLITCICDNEVMNIFKERSGITNIVEVETIKNE